jgi:fructose-1-phosphate kinase PfkB-like protein
MGQEPDMKMSDNLAKLREVGDALGLEFHELRERVERLTREHAGLVLVVMGAQKALMAEDMNTLVRIIREAKHAGSG